MLIGIGEKIHVVMRRAYEKQVQRHFAGEIIESDGSVVRATGYVFIYDESKAKYIRKAEQRTTVMDLAESGYIVNLIPKSVDIEDLSYQTIDRTFMAVVDGKGFMLDINEFGSRR